MRRYMVSDGLRYNLQCKVEGIDPKTGEKVRVAAKEFPDKNFDWVEQYSRFEEYMNNNQHLYVNLGAAIKGDGLLTDHGIEHIRSVIAHARDILTDPMQLTGYEIYLLLISIHFHDVGNIQGREQHEEKIVDIIEELGSNLPLDNAEKSFVTAIATAHGGYVDGDKDTIRAINVDTLYDGVQIRCKLLASILRFADEISDDLRRANFPGVSVPVKNQAYHEYSRALDPISIKGETLIMHFRIPYDMTQNKIGKDDNSVYLYDEILERIAKCMRELEYCRKYACGMIQLSTMNVTIDFLNKGSKFQSKDSSFFRLTLHGYPDKLHSSVFDYLDDNNDSRGVPYCLRFKNGGEVCAAMKVE